MCDVGKYHKAISVSVVVPTYNRAHSIGAALDSILAQDPLPDEVIVVDDGSTDNTSDVLAAYGDRITVLRQKNAGAAAARNAGIRHATSEWVAFLDSDDLWRPGRMAVLYRDLSEAGEDIVGHTGDMRITGVGCEIGLFDLRNLKLKNGAKLLLMHPLSLTISGLPLQATAVRRTQALSIGLFDETLRIYEDADFLCKIALKGSWIFIGDIVAELRRLSDDEDMLSGVERKFPIEAASARAKYITGLLGQSFSKDLELLIMRRASGALLTLAAAEKRAMVENYRNTLVMSARQHPSFFKGWVKILPPLLLGNLGFKISLRDHKAFTRS